MRLAILAQHQWSSVGYEPYAYCRVFEKIEPLCGDVVITDA